MMSKKLILVALLSLIFLLSFITINGIPETIVERYNYLLKNYPQEKVYLQTDKPHYTIGDTIWLGVVATNATFYDISPVSSIVYLQMTNENDVVVENYKIKLQDKNGQGYIAIDNKYKPGPFSISAYTAYQLNYDNGYIFTKDIMIWPAGQINSTIKTAVENKITDLEVSFFPEGGQLVDGVECVVAFEILDQNNQPKQSSIEILNQDDLPITKSKTLYDGMGFFAITPKKGEKYYAKIEGKETKIELPASEAYGYTMKVLNRTNDVFSAIVQTNVPKGLEGCFIICHVRGEIFHIEKDLKGVNHTIKINKNDLTSGVAQITLFDAKGLPVAERSIYIQNTNEIPDVRIEIPYAYFRSRSKAEVSVLLTDKNGNPIQGDYMVSVFDANTVHYSKSDQDIFSYFMLTSDLSKNIRRPGDYLKEFTSKNLMLLDLLMMTQNYNRIPKEQLNSSTDPRLQYGPEHGITIRGTVFKNEKPGNDLKVDLSILEGGLYVDEIRTDAYGRFAFYDIPAVKGQTVHLKAYEVRNGKEVENASNIRISLDNTSGYQIKPTFESTIHWSEQFAPKEFLKSSLEKTRTDSLYSSMSVTVEEVSIKAKKISRKQELAKGKTILYGNPQTRLELDSMKIKNPNWNVLELVAYNSPGARLVGLRPQQTIQLSGSPRQKPPMILLDGNPISYETALIIDINTLEFFDVVSRLSGVVLYGDQAEGGIIGLYSKIGGSNKKQAITNAVKYIADGYQDNKYFYSPDYSLKSVSMKPDVRTTLFWSPFLKTDEDGISNFTFYTADNLSKYLIRVEGMTKDGRPFSGIQNFDVK
jgi:hypothetical protein